MSAVPVRPLSDAPRWILGFWLDQLLIVFTPLLVIPAVLLIHRSLGIEAETISVVVTAFFALGHHLPGMIRAYGDLELFQRFRTRFLIVPPLLFTSYFIMLGYHSEFFQFVIILWATWHGLMQLYGFVRIYDAKAGSTSRATAYWDWLVCLCGFITVELFSPSRMAFLLRNWYSLGGPLLPPWSVMFIRQAGLVICLFVLIGFTINYVMQWLRGPKPSPFKVPLLASGIGSWWFATDYLENPLLGAALFDICHDVQYLAIVWLFNCRRVSSNPALGGFMKYVFRRGMVLLYLGLIAAYGALGLVPALVKDGTVVALFNGILATSTLLHYYYDGFIWKVREPSTRLSLGVSSSTSPTSVNPVSSRDWPHILKWSPVILALGWLFLSDAIGPQLTQNQKGELERHYAKTLLGQTTLPTDLDQQSWLYTMFARAQNVAAAIPDDQTSQLSAAIMLANFGRGDEAMVLLEKLLARNPACGDAYTVLGGIYSSRGDLNRSRDCFEKALTYARSADEKSMANLKLGEIDLRQNNRSAAEARFQAALKENPRLAETVQGLRRSNSSLLAPLLKDR